MFVLNPKDLNDEQIQAIEQDNNILLIACPGSGKTRTLTYKIAYELSKLNSNKKYIVAITYTNKAADEIKERVEYLGINTKQLWIGTIHSFCLEWIVRPYSLYIPKLKYGFRVINSHDTEEMITRLCNEYNEEHHLSGKNKIKYWDCDFVFTSDLKFTVISASDSKKKAVKSILKNYFKLLGENRQIDFELILYCALKLLIEKPIIGRTLSNIFSYILVDEYQDTKDIQYHILGAILRASEGTGKLFMVGDPNQSIFKSLGGYPIKKDNLETLTNLDIEQLSLSKNYRSSKKIVEYFEHYKTFTTPIEASGEFQDYDSLITFDKVTTKDNLTDEIVKLVLLNINEKNIPQNEICILAPWWVHILSLTRKLMAKLPDYRFNSPGLAPFVRDIDNFWYKVSKVILTQSSPDLYVRRIRWASEILNELENVGVNISNLSNKKVLKICNSITVIEEDGLLFLEQYFRELFVLLEIDKDNFPMLKEHYEAFFESAQKRIDRLEKDGIEYAGNIETFKKIFRQKDGITVSTIHGVKGLEYDTVIAVGLLEDIVPHFADKDKQDSAKKQLYVIASRARKNLHLISERERFKNFGNPPPEYQVTAVLNQYNYQYD